MIKKRKSSKNTLKYKSTVTANSMSDSFSHLLDSYTLAMQENSDLIAAVLEAMKDKGIPEDYKIELESIEDRLKKINKDLDRLGD